MEFIWGGEACYEACWRTWMRLDLRKVEAFTRLGLGLV